MVFKRILSLHIRSTKYVYLQVVANNDKTSTPINHENKKQTNGTCDTTRIINDLFY